MSQADSITVTVLLGGNLRKEAQAGPMERRLEIPAGSRVTDLIDRLELPMKRVRMVFLNGRALSPETELAENDRVGLFPPELAFNTHVSMSYAYERMDDD